MVVAIVILGLGFLNVIPGFHLGGNGGGGGGGGGAPTYAVNFTETGLPASTLWSVTTGGATVSSSTTFVSFAEPNGTYSYSVGCVSGYTASPTNGTLHVAGGPVSRAVTFSVGGTCLIYYSVSFTESGLPSGTSWSVTLHGTSQSASAPNSIVFQEPNGSYSYAVGSVAGYTEQPSSGTLVVAGSAISQAIVYTSSGGGSAVDSSQAMTIGGSTVQGYHGQSWYLVALVAFVQPTATILPFGNFTQGCAYSGTSTVTVPGFSGSLTSGNSGFWLLGYNQTGSTTNHLAVTVSDGSGAVIGTFTGTTCTLTEFGDLNGLTLLTSAQAITAVNSGGNVTAFLNSHAATYAGMDLLGVNIGGTTVYVWTLDWATCNIITHTPAGGIELTWFVDAQNGITGGSPTITSC